MRKVLLAFTVVLSLVTISIIGYKSLKTPIYLAAPSMNHRIDNMPILSDHLFAALYAKNDVPRENRSEGIRKWLSPSVLIGVTNASGSGTIIYYDHTDGYAYVQSCGHLWSGNMTASEGKYRKVTCDMVTWYHNEKKLSASHKYPGEVLYYNNERGEDVSLSRFKPDWVPDYFPIAPEGYPISKNMRLHSVGCDGGREVAHYDVIVVGYQLANNFNNKVDLITNENSPRPGRSGGGLMSDESYYIGICWGTSDESGRGIGLFTPLKTLREHNVKNGFGWLNDIGFSLARKIPIKDRNNPQGTYPKDYIPLPNRRSSGG